MKIIWLFFMTMAFGIISMITSKKYNLKGELKELSLIHISEPTRRRGISYAVFCLKKKKETATLHS